MRKPRPCELYRHLDKEGRLLYVGISYRTIERLVGGHKQASHWFDQVARIEIERFPSREEALKAEGRAIENEKPLFNIATDTKRGNACLSDAVKAEKAVWIKRAEAAGVKVRGNACVSAIQMTALAAEAGDFERAKLSTAYLRLTQRLSTPTSISSTV